MIGIATAGLTGGCQGPDKTEQALLFFPAPPAQPRVQFLTWASGADQVEPARGSFQEFILGEEPVIQRAINKPYGVAVRDGVAYVCDTKGLALSRLDFKNQTYSVLGVRGPGRLRKPINVAIDSLGYKFVVDPERKQVVVFDPYDQYVTAFDIPEPCHPVDLAIYGNELYVLDNDETCQIVVLERSTGQVLRTFGEPGGEPGQFKIPGSLCVGPEGNVYVSDTHNWRIQKLTRDGEPIWVKGAPGYTLGRFGRPRGIRVGPDGIIYLVDAATEIVQMFDSEGRVLMRFGGPGNIPGALGLPSTLAIDSTSIPYFEEYVHEDFEIDYLLFVISQYGAHLVNVYAFGSFPEGYELAESQIASLPEIASEQGIAPLEAPDQATDVDQADQERADDDPG
ncbi:MAG: NHL repeat-containing protein [Planctomycetota bacterium]